MQQARRRVGLAGVWHTGQSPHRAAAARPLAESPGRAVSVLFWCCTPLLCRATCLLGWVHSTHTPPHSARTAGAHNTHGRLGVGGRALGYVVIGVRWSGCGDLGMPLNLSCRAEPLVGGE